MLQKGSIFHFARGPTNSIAKSGAGGRAGGQAGPAHAGPFHILCLLTHSSGLQIQETTYRQASIDTCSGDSRLFQMAVGLWIDHSAGNSKATSVPFWEIFWGLLCIQSCEFLSSLVWRGMSQQCAERPQLESQIWLGLLGQAISFWISCLKR